MSTSAITSSLLSTVIDSSSTANQFATNLNQLAKDLKSGNLAGAQQDYVTLSQDLQNGGGSASATTSDSGITVSLLSDVAGSTSSLSSFSNALNQIGTDLNNGSLSSAQQDLLTLDSTALNAAGSASGSAVASTTSQANPATLIHAIVQALSAGDSASASLGLSQLASVSSSSKGASYLEAFSSSLSSSSSSSAASSANWHRAPREALPAQS